MTKQEVRNKILEIFKTERNNSLDEFNESHFMNFLTNPSHNKNN